MSAQCLRVMFSTDDKSFHRCYINLSPTAMPKNKIYLSINLRNPQYIPQFYM